MSYCELLRSSMQVFKEKEMKIAVDYYKFHVSHLVACPKHEFDSVHDCRKGDSNVCRKCNCRACRLCVNLCEIHKKEKKLLYRCCAFCDRVSECNNVCPDVERNRRWELFLIIFLILYSGWSAAADSLMEIHAVNATGLKISASVVVAYVAALIAMYM